MNKAFKFRIYPTTEQKVMFAKTFGCVRFIYNRMLGDKIVHYKATQEMLSTTPAQYKGQFPWLKEVDSLALCNAQLNLQSAYQKFFKEKDSGFPRFKSKRDSHQSYTTNRVGNNISIADEHLRLPKIGMVKMKQHRAIPDGHVLKSVTISKAPTGAYYASLLFQYELSVAPVVPEKFLGMDYSMPELYVDNDGNEPAYPRYYRKMEEKLAREQRKLSLMKKGSGNRRKQRVVVAKLHERVANQRKDFLHKLSRQITNAYDCVCVEDLNMKAMSQSLNFGKSVSDNGWGMFTSLLEYKLKEQGKQLVRIDKFFPSSQLCHVCGYKNNAMKDLSLREWVCPQCGTYHSRDMNAAINIRNEGRRMVSMMAAV